MKYGFFRLSNVKANESRIVDSSTISLGTVPYDANRTVAMLNNCSNIVDPELSMMINNSKLVVYPKVNNNWIQIYWVCVWNF